MFLHDSFTANVGKFWEGFQGLPGKRDGSAFLLGIYAFQSPLF